VATRLGALADLVGGRVHGDRSLRIRGLAPLETATPHELSFLSHPRYRPLLATSTAGAVVAPAGTEIPNGVLLEHTEPYAAFARLMNHFHPDPPHIPGVHPTAYVDPGAEVHDTATIGAGAVVMAGARVLAVADVGANAVVGSDVAVGKGTRIAPGATVLAGTQLGARCRIGPGAVVGSAGFGYAPTSEGWVRIPQTGVVILEDEVEVGANTTVDRATLGETRIAAGSKLDNLVQVGHNVVIGRGTVIAAQSGISGSSRLGEQVQIGGQTGVVGHLTIGDGARIGAGSGVASDVPPGATRSGMPVFDHAGWRRSVAAFPRLPDLLKRVRELERQVSELKAAVEPDDESR